MYNIPGFLICILLFQWKCAFLFVLGITLLNSICPLDHLISYMCIASWILFSVMISPNMKLISSFVRASGFLSWFIFHRMSRWLSFTADREDDKRGLSTLSGYKEQCYVWLCKYHAMKGRHKPMLLLASWQWSVEAIWFYHYVGQIKTVSHACLLKRFAHITTFITMTTKRARWRLKLPASRLLTQVLIQAQIKENIKAPRHWPLCGEFTGGRWIPRTKGQ